MANSHYIEAAEIKKDDILLLPDPDFNAANVCIVTGATSGIGRAVAVAAAANGLLTVGLGRREEAGLETVDIARKLGGRMVFLQTDLTRDEDVESAVRQAAKLGTIKYLANIAGIQHVCAIEDFPMEQYDYMQRLMVRAPFYLSKLAIPHMKDSSDGKGVIAAIGSIHAHICTLNKSVYSMTKFATRGLTQSISAEGAGKIRSFTVTVPYTKTPLVLNQIPAQARTRQMTQQQVVTEVMLGRARIKEMMTPIEAANLFMFGFSRHARFLVGSDLTIDAGMISTY